MAGLAASGSRMTLLDFAKRTDSKGGIQHIAELLTDKKALLGDLSFKEANQATSELVTVRTSLPEASFVMHGQGGTPVSSSTAQNTFPCKMVEIWGENPASVLTKGGNLAANRLSESTPLIESINQKVEDTLFYGNASTDEKKFSGLATYYNSLSGENSRNVLNGEATGSDNTSIYLVSHGTQGVYGAFPAGSTAGIKHTDYKKRISNQPDGTLLEVYTEHLQFEMAFVLKDWRYAVRICNLDVSALRAGSGADLPELMIKATHRIETTKNACFYVNRAVAEQLDIQARADVISGGGLTYQTIDGMPVPFFRGIPVKTVDAIIESESLVS
jgi:hypothetical protein